MKITNPEEMQKLSAENRLEYEKGVMEGPLFKKIMDLMEASALEGFSGFKKSIDDDEDLRDYRIIQKSFVDAGYKCEVNIEQGIGAFGLPRTKLEFIVSWDNNKK